MSAEDRVGSELPLGPLRFRARAQLATLLIQLLVGMAVNLIGLPSQTSGKGRILSSVVLGTHVLLAIGQLIVAFLTIRPAAILGSRERGLAWAGVSLIVATFAGGVLSIIPGGGWWSYLMVAGTTFSLPTYGILYVRAIQQGGRTK